MALDRELVQEALRRVPHPIGGVDLVDIGAVAKVAACDGFVSVRLNGGGLSEDQRRRLMADAGAAVRLRARERNERVAEVHVDVTEDMPAAPMPAATPPAPQPARGAAAKGAAAPGLSEKPDALPNVRHIIAVGAGKGGVGKSTIAVNLAVGLARRGHAVGLMDGDIYGPSLPTLLGLGAMDVNLRGNMFQPFLVHGVKSMTLGKLVEPEKPLVWRGPMAHGAFKQLVEQTEWGELDYLIIDLPPGTGDISLTMAQLLRLTGAVIVCTPQKVAQDDAVRAANMFKQLSIEVLGVVENMAYFVGDDGKEYDLFGRGGARQMAQRLGTPFLGEVAITTALRQNSDAGNPSANFDEVSGRGGGLRRDLESLVQNLESQVALAGVRSGRTRPTLTIR